MEIYDSIPRVLLPYITTTTQPDFHSTVVNTDELGFRVSHINKSIVDSRTWWDFDERAVVIGGSTVFGIGASKDTTTISSQLGDLTNTAFLNLGIRAGNSTQELIATLPFIGESRNIVICSGINNLLVNLQSIGINDLYGPLFAEEVLHDLSTYSIHEIRESLKSTLKNINTRTILNELSSRVISLLTGRGRIINKRRDSSYRPIEDAFNQALSIQCRYLNFMAKAMPNKDRLIFISQPFGEVESKNRTIEEQQLFEISDSMQGSQWELMKSQLVDMWPRYVADLRKFCQAEGIEFYCLDDLQFNGWTFVDRVHLTDNGYGQIARFISSKL